jgi:hypothetical protein
MPFCLRQNMQPQHAIFILRLGSIFYLFSRHARFKCKYLEIEILDFALSRYAGSRVAMIIFHFARPRPSSGEAGEF